MFHNKHALPFLLLFPLNFVSRCERVLHSWKFWNRWWQTANTMSLWNGGVMNGKTWKVMVQQSERCLWHSNGRTHRTTTWKDTVKLCNKNLAQKNDSKVCTKQWQEGLDLRTKANCNYEDGKNSLNLLCCW